MPPVSLQMYRKYVDVLRTATVGLLVCDEGHRLKNSTGNKTIGALSKCQTQRRLLLTGTPVQNRLQVAWRPLLCRDGASTSLH